jgi:hypothetical protein
VQPGSYRFRLYEPFLEENDFNIKKIFSPKDAKDIVDSFLEDKNNKVALIGDCCFGYKAHRCFYEMFKNYDYSNRLDILVTGVDSIHDCRLHSQIPIPHISIQDVSLFEKWLSSYLLKNSKDFLKSY